MIVTNEYDKYAEDLPYEMLERYDALQADFYKFRSAVGSTKNHSKNYLVAVAMSIRKTMAKLRLEPEDEYGSVAAALKLWDGLLLQVHKRLGIKRKN